jgi:hypothetical protein
MIPLKEIKDYLENVEVPTQLKLNEHTYITDTKKFIDSHISTLERNTGNRPFLPYYERLCDFYKKIKYEQTNT